MSLRGWARPILSTGICCLALIALSGVLDGWARGVAAFAITVAIGLVLRMTGTLRRWRI